MAHGARFRFPSTRGDERADHVCSVRLVHRCHDTVNLKDTRGFAMANLLLLRSYEPVFNDPWWRTAALDEVGECLPLNGLFWSFLLRTEYIHHISIYPLVS